MKKANKMTIRPRLNSARWVDLVRGQEHSGLGVKEYCTAQGISVASYYRWQKLLKEEQCELFSPIEIERMPVVGIVVELPGGLTLRFNELPPVAYLHSLSSSFSGRSI